MFPRTFSTAFIVTLACLLTPIESAAQEQTRFVLKLTNDLVNNLKTAGSLSSSVNPQFRERISMIELQYADTSENEPITIDTNMAVNDGEASLSISDDMIDSIKSQPVRIMVPESQREFSRIKLAYGGSSNLAQPITPVLNDAGQPVDMYYVKLKGGESMAGGIDGFDKFEMDTRFGKVSMPMEQVAGIKFHVDDKDAAVVILNNGDSITGVPMIPAIELKTDWGKAEIEPKFIDALTTTQNAKFNQQSTDFGVRWELKTGNSFAPGPGRSSGRMRIPSTEGQ